MATLRKSPHTSQLVPLRAEEILQLVIEKPICMKLEEQIRVLEGKLEDERRNRKTMRSDSKRQQSENERFKSEK